MSFIFLCYVYMIIPEDIHFIDTFVPHIKTKTYSYSDYIYRLRFWSQKYSKYFQVTFKWRGSLFQYKMNVEIQHNFAEIFFVFFLIYKATKRYILLQIARYNTLSCHKLLQECVREALLNNVKMFLFFQSDSHQVNYNQKLSFVLMVDLGN